MYSDSRVAAMLRSPRSDMATFTMSEVRELVHAWNFLNFLNFWIFELAHAVTFSNVRRLVNNRIFRSFVKLRHFHQVLFTLISLIFNFLCRPKSSGLVLLDEGSGLCPAIRIEAVWSCGVVPDPTHGWRCAVWPLWQVLRTTLRLS